MDNRGERTANSLGLGGMDCLADRSGALYLPAERTLVVSDLHLEKSSSFARRGRFLPPYDTHTTLARLGEVAVRYRARRVVALGDSFHDPDAPFRLNETARQTLAEMQAGRTWLWITGNHDPQVPAFLGGDVAGTWEVGGIALRHEPSIAPAAPEVAGHMHPCARVKGRGGTVRRPCFVATPERIILPAFGAFTGGLNVLEPVFAPLLTGGKPVAHVIGRNGIYPVSFSILHGDNRL